MKVRISLGERASGNVATTVALVGGLILAAAVATALLLEPPLLGWIGFAIVAAVVLALGVALALAIPRMRVWPQLPARARDSAHRLLLVADPSCDVEALVETIGGQLVDDVAVHVVMPTRVSRLHFLTEDEFSEHRDAEQSLAEAVQLLRRRGIAASGTVGSDKPLESLTDALGSFAATHVVLALPPEPYWLERDLLTKAQKLTDLSVTQTVIAPKQG
jgi:hypothetical protein